MDTEVVSETAVTVYEGQSFMPVLTVKDAVNRFDLLAKFVSEALVVDVDYGVIPGTGTKPVLLKPGAEKLCTFFGLSVDIEVADKVEDWVGGFFYYKCRCAITRNGQLVATAEGSCNSKEVKYRYRKAQRTCPKCQKATIITGKAEYGGGYICFAKKGGCGAKFSVGDRSIESQPQGDVENTEPYDLVNTILKMAAKRSHVATTLIAVNASQFFTQDIEDMAEMAARAVETATGEETLSGLDRRVVPAEIAQCEQLLRELYGDNWVGMAVKAAESVSKGATKNLQQLHQPEAADLLKRLRARKEKNATTTNDSAPSDEGTGRKEEVRSADEIKQSFVDDPLGDGGGPAPPVTTSLPPRQEKDRPAEPSRYRQPNRDKGNPISPAQAKRFFGLAHANLWEKADIEELLKRYGYAAVEEIGWKDYKAICEDLETPASLDDIRAGMLEENPGGGFDDDGAWRTEEAPVHA